MIKYKCGHETDGVIFLNNNLLSVTAYFQWASSVGVDGTKQQCWSCYCKEINKKVKVID